MSVAAQPVFQLDDSFARQLEGLYEPWAPAPASEPRVVVLNDELAWDLGLDTARLRSSEGVAVLAGNAVPQGATTLAQAYAGHQFGGYSPRLGDGRALLLGEVVDRHGVRRDIHLKGSGRTPFARGGDGLAAVGPMLREYLMGEAMHGLGIPTTRMLAVVATGDSIIREVEGRAAAVPGAVLTRIASSHLRVGTFQFAAATGEPHLLRSLTDYAIARHVPDAAAADLPALALFDHVVAVQADLVAKWMLVGFIHGVLNTDNVTISGETIDFGPCAFMDAYDPATVFSSIDHGGRYAFGNQPAVTTWNLARLAEAMLPLFDDDTDAAVEVATAALESFPERFRTAWRAGMRAKLGLVDEGDDHLVDDLLTIMGDHGVDYTNGLRSLSGVVRGDRDAALVAFGADATASFDRWAARWLPQIGADTDDVAARMDRLNPIYIPRNQVVEEALTAAAWGDVELFDQLVDAVSRPYERRPHFERFEQPGRVLAGYQTFCGT